MRLPFGLSSHSFPSADFLQGFFSRLPAGAKAVKPRLYAAIDRATSEYLSAPNLAQNMDVVSTINSAVDPTYAANKACKRICLRMRTRNQRVQYVALQLTENCVRSCGESFHVELAKSDLLTELARMADRSVWCATEIQRLVLALIQEWAYEIKLPQFSTLYNRLKQRGMPFEPRGAPIEAQLQPYPGLSPPPPGAHPGAPGQQFRPYPQGQPYPQGPGQGSGENGRPPSRSAGILGPDLLKPGRSPAQLNSDLEAARGTVALLTEVLDGAEAEANWGAVKEEYCVEVAAACQAVQDRVAGLLGAGLSDEAVVSAALEVNDEAQKVLERRANLIDVAEGKRPPPPPRTTPPAAAAAAAAPAAIAPPPTEPAVNGTSTAAPAAEPAPAPAAAPGPLLDLLDLDWEPSTTAGPVSDPFLPPPPMEPPAMNNPFAAAAAAAAATPAPAFPPQAFSPTAAAGTAGAGPSWGADAFPASSVSPTAAAGTAGAAGGAAPWGADAFPAAPATSSSPPAGASPQAQPAETNPFLSDDAFASVSSQGAPTAAASAPAAAAAAAPLEPVAPQVAPPPHPVPAPAAPAAPASSGNPFAAFGDAAGGDSTAASGSFKRPPPVMIPGGDANIPPAPFTAPAAYPGAGGFDPGFAHQGPMTTAGPAQAFHQWGAPTPTAGPGPQSAYPQVYGQGPMPVPGQYSAAPSPYPGVAMPSPAFAPTAGSGYPGSKPSDAFKDLVALAPKKEEPPPPPK